MKIVITFINLINSLGIGLISLFPTTPAYRLAQSNTLAAMADESRAQTAYLKANIRMGSIIGIFTYMHNFD